MHVTNDSFKQLLPQIIRDIKAAQFIAIDSEFTGLGTATKEFQYDIMDSLQERYSKTAQICKAFLPLQIGICAFHYAKEEQQYVAKPYNFYIFPRSGSRIFGLDRHFSSQVSSLEFLQKNSFDWNKWIGQGIPFVNHEDEARINLKLDAMPTLDPPLKVGDGLYEFQEELILKTKHFLQNSVHRSYFVDAASGAHKRVINNCIRREFNGFVGLNNNRKTVELVKLTVEEREENLKNSKERMLKVNKFNKDELNELIGFRRVVDIISECKIPIVGHNMFLDLCYFYQNFYKALPDSFDDFCKSVGELFPVIYDSKYVSSLSIKLASSSGYLNTGLQELFEKLEIEYPNAPRIMLGREFDSEERNSHEAGYDAYCTGVCFLKTLVADEFADVTNQVDFEKSSALQNKIYLMTSAFPFLSLDGKNESPDYSNIFKVSDFPTEWTTTDVQLNLRDLGSFFVKWIGNDSCLIILKDRNCIPLAKEKCDRKVKKSHNFVISPVEKSSNGSEEISRKRKRDEAAQDLHPSKKNQCAIQ